jgi:hypothetical protein
MTGYRHRPVTSVQPSEIREVEFFLKPLESIVSNHAIASESEQAIAAGRQYFLAEWHGLAQRMRLQLALTNRCISHRWCDSPPIGSTRLRHKKRPLPRPSREPGLRPRGNLV